jgi:hypothetical protein
MQLPRVIILAAGRGTRLGALGHETPKPLLSFGNEPLLLRTLRQLHECAFKDITVVTGYRSEVVGKTVAGYLPSVSFVENPLYAQDKNIFSLLQGLKGNDDAALIIEADVAFSDAAILDLRNKLESDGPSIWTTCGLFRSGQVGGILKADKSGRIAQMTYREYEPALSDWYKNLGAIFVSGAAMPLYADLLRRQAQKNMDCYLMTVWAGNLSSLPCMLLDVGRTGGATFNTPDEYALALRDILGAGAGMSRDAQIEYMELACLKHIEDFSQDRAEWLAQKISDEGIWTYPLCVDKKHGLIMDGQHRYEAAKILGLKKVPVVHFNYSEVEIWSLRPDTHVVNLPLLLELAARGEIYPEKTVKHRFPHTIPNTAIKLNILQKL